MALLLLSFRVTHASQCAERISVSNIPTQFLISKCALAVRSLELAKVSEKRENEGDMHQRNPLTLLPVRLPPDHHNV